MDNNEFKKLDTKSFDDFNSKKSEFVSMYDEINSNYERIVSNLLENWKGYGASAFKEDATNIKTNITHICDVIQDMFSLLTDCYDVFERCDQSLGNYNRNPTPEE